MMKTTRQRLCALLAYRAGCSVADIHAWQHLERDLDLTPLELVLIALELGETEHVEIPVEELATEGTVGDLASSLRRVLGRARRAKAVGRVA